MHFPDLQFKEVLEQFLSLFTDWILLFFGNGGVLSDIHGWVVERSVEDLRAMVDNNYSRQS